MGLDSSLDLPPDIAFIPVQKRRRNFSAFGRVQTILEEFFSLCVPKKVRKFGEIKTLQAFAIKC